MSTGNLSHKQKRFVEEYLVDLNATQAAIRAGYSARSAKQTGSRLKQRPDVMAAVDAGRAKLSEKTGITQERVLSELARIGFANILDYMTLDHEGLARVDLSTLSRDQAAAIAAVEVDTRRTRATDGAETAEVEKVKFKLYDKRAALVDLGKHLGLFTEKHEHAGKDGAPLIPNDTELARRLAFLLTKGAHAG